MSTQTFPTLPVGWSVIRKALWATRKNNATSGAEVTIRDRAYPLYQWEVLYEGLREGDVGDFSGRPWTEFSTLFGFYNKMGGGWDTFQYFDNLDNTVTNQGIGTADGSTTVFQLVRSFGGFTEPVFAPFSGNFHVYVGGTETFNYSLNPWGTASPSGPGTIQFGFTPSVGQAIEVSMSYAWPCRFVEDECDFEQFAQGFVAVKKLAFKSITQGYSL